MNTKVTFPELIEAVATATNTSKKDSEIFLKELFALISNSLRDGENVKVRNLGVFKLVDVDARKSVNVNTGEEMEIPGHKKVVFVPDKSLAEAINAPFASFGTVTLSGELTDDELRKMSNTEADEIELPEDTTEETVDDAISTSDGKEAEEEVVIVEKTDDAVPPKFDKKDTEEVVAEKEVEKPIEDVTPPTFVKKDSDAEAIKTDAEETVDVEKAKTEATVEDSDGASTIIFDNKTDEEDMDKKTENEEIDKVSSSQGDTDKPVTEKPRYVMPEIEDDDEEYIETVDNKKKDNKDNRFMRGFLWGALSMFFVYLVLMGVFYMFHVNSINQAKEEMGLTDSIDVEEETALAMEESAIVEEEPAIVEEEVVATSEPEVKKEEKPVVTQVAKNAVVYDTITKNMFLAHLAKKHYGHSDFWVYIYEENKSKIKNPDNVSPGTVVVIPPASKYGIDKNNAESLRKARNKVVEIDKKK